MKNSLQVIKGIYRLQVPNPYSPLCTNSYLLEGNNGYLLIDTGWDTSEALDSMERQLTEIGVSFKDIAQIIATHSHPDHYGLASRLRQLSQARIALHYLERDILRFTYLNTDKVLQDIDRWLAMNGSPKHELPELRLPSDDFSSPVLSDTVLENGDTLSTGSLSFEVIWTPGHSPGHICLYESTNKLLFSGDHILPVTIPNVGLHPQSSPNPLDDYLNSLRRLRNLDVKLVLPGHEQPFAGLERINDIIAQHEQRSSNILETIRSRAKTAYEIAIASRLLDAEAVGWQDLSGLNKRLLMMETLAHLESLRIQKKVIKYVEGNITYYQSN